jgi:LuxR family maltose regulon positive regulatory protein
MPKAPTHVLLWSAESHRYILRTSSDYPPQQIMSGNEEAWRAWLTTHSSFSFQGQNGYLSVLKEVRPRGTGYWYVYHTSAGQTRKRYLGRSEAVTPGRLEEMAQILQGLNSESPQVSSSPPVSLQPTHARKDTFSSTLSQDSELRGMVVTRFSPPVPPVMLVVRERLLSTLDTAFSRPLTLLSASAGWGKTTLLSVWARRYPQTVAWLSLEALDNDPRRFWLSIIAALRRCRSEIGVRALTLLQSVASEPLSLSLTDLLNELADRTAETSPILLILDDYQVIEEPTIHASLTFWLEHLPPHVHLVLASRVDPDLSLSRFRVRGYLGEIRDTDLRFTREETHRFLTQSMGLALSESDIALLEARTEGWIASLHLAALVLQKHTDPSTYVQTLSGSQRFLLDYMREEIFANLTSELQDFLLKTSGLNHLSASLCDALMDREDSHRLLEEMERANLFLQPLDESSQWYRYHPLWAQGLQYEARRRLGVDTVRLMSRRASQWYEQQYQLPEAIEAALAGEEFLRVATLIERFTLLHGFRNVCHTLYRWLRQLPEQIMREYPEICFLYVLALTFATDRRSPGTGEKIGRFLQWAEQGFEAKEAWEKLGEVLQLHAELAFFQDDLACAFALARQAQPFLSEQSSMYPDHILTHGLEAFLAGRMDVAWQHFLEAYRSAKRLGSRSISLAALLLLGEVCREKSELRKASQYYHQALALIDEDQETIQQQLQLKTGDSEAFFASWAYYNLAALSYEWNEKETARRSISQALALRVNQEDEVHVLASASLIQARLLYAYGEKTQAQDMLLRWEMHAHFAWSVRAIRACQARLQLTEGALSSVAQWPQAREHVFNASVHEQEKDLPLLRQQEEALLLVRLHIAQGESEEALRILVPWKTQAQKQQRLRSTLEMHLLEALAHFSQKRLPEAKQLILSVVTMAQDEGYQRLFLDEGQGIETLLKMLLPELREVSLVAYVRTLLHAFALENDILHGDDTPHGKQETLLLEPLSEQEQRALRLLVAGRSNLEIARELVISVNTVKTHVQSLYRKLRVHNRVEASEVARRLSLL